MNDVKLYQYRSIIRSNSINFGPHDQRLVATLPQMSLMPQNHDFSATLLDVLRAHPRYEPLCRVCLVRRIGRSNQIKVVSSANSSQSAPNNMEQGYSCFVASEGSLFKLGLGTLRVFENAQAIVDQFKKDNRPPQRSILRIAKMGFQSGLFLPIFDSEKVMCGGLFMNFRQSMPLFYEEVDWALLSMIESYAHNAIGFGMNYLWSHTAIDSEYWLGSPFNETMLTNAIRVIDPNRNLRVTVAFVKDSFMVSHANLATMLLWTSRVQSTNKLELVVEVDRSKMDVSVSISGLIYDPVSANYLLEISRYLGYDLVVNAKHFKWIFPYEACDGMAQPYSIELS